MSEPIRWFYDAGYNYGGGLPLRQVHGFVLDKPQRIHARLLAEHGLVKRDFESVEPASREALLRVHDARLVDDLDSQAAVARAVEMAPLRWLPAFVVRRAIVAPQVLACGGTTAALRAAADGAWAFNCSGGYHHARPSLSHGFCLVNDVAVAVAALRREGRDPAVLVLDLDLHQGDGNIAAFDGDARVFTASMHEAEVFPFPKLEGDLDVALPSGLGDADYLETLERTLDAISARFEPEVVVYVAGTDPYVTDPLGSLRLSREGLRARDERVARWVQARGAGLVALPSGGYTPVSPELSADGFAAMAAVRRSR